jgi:hypothetical protein
MKRDIMEGRRNTGAGGKAMRGRKLWMDGFLGFLGFLGFQAFALHNPLAVLGVAGLIAV